VALLAVTAVEVAVAAQVATTRVPAFGSKQKKTVMPAAAVEPVAAAAEAVVVRNKVVHPSPLSM
jgi:hypothetical protein